VKLSEAGKTPHPMLSELLAALSVGSKGDFVRAITCGGGGVDMAERKGACTDGDCDECGFGRMWSQALRKALVTDNGTLRGNVDRVWHERVYWSGYVKQTKALSPRAAAAADEDVAWEL
jgi:hypothetical protein